MEVAHGAARRRAGGLPASGGGVRALLVARPLVPHGVRTDETHDGDGGSDVSISLKADTEFYRSPTGDNIQRIRVRLGLSCVNGPFWLVRAGCYSRAALSLPHSKPLYREYVTGPEESWTPAHYCKHHKKNSIFLEEFLSRSAWILSKFPHFCSCARILISLIT